MGLADIQRKHLQAAVAEFDRLGRGKFLAKYGFGPARSYFLAVEGKLYDSKAVVGAAHGYATGIPLTADQFSGGAATVQPLLEGMGFRVEWEQDAARCQRRREELLDVADELVAQGEFNPSTVEEARERVLCAIALRQGQPAFRKQLLDAYGGRCAVTDCGTEEALEAAHILPYRGDATNHVQNGLLLRADLHTLFDRYLLAVDSTLWKVVLAPALRDGSYGRLHGKELALPEVKAMRPSKEALALHRKEAGF